MHRRIRALHKESIDKHPPLGKLSGQTEELFGVPAAIAQEDHIMDVVECQLGKNQPDLRRVTDQIETVESRKICKFPTAFRVVRVVDRFQMAILFQIGLFEYSDGRPEVGLLGEVGLSIDQLPSKARDLPREGPHQLLSERIA